MTIRGTLLVVIAAFILTVESEQGAEVFTDDDFSTRLTEHDTVLVMFYAPWCGHCKKLKPEFEKAAGSLRSNDPPVILAKVDCTEGGKDTCSKYSVTGYPTLKIFRGGEFSQEYQGPRDSSGIVKYMKSQVGPSSKELKTVKDYEDFLSKDEVGIAGFFDSDSSLKDAFLKTADKLREKARFGHSVVSEVLGKAGYKDDVVLYRPKHLSNKFEPDFVRFEGSPNRDEIEQFINKNYHGLVGIRQRDNQQDFQNPQIIAFYNVDYVKNPKGTNYWRNRILKVAQNYKDSFTFAVSAKDDFQHELNEYGFDYLSGEKPQVCSRDAKGQKFIMKDEFSMETFEKFLNDLKGGKLDPYLKSEPIPEDNSGPVTVAVASNFEDVVVNNDKDTLVEFYAPWCGHCKKLGPTFDELGEKLKDEKVSIVKMDATANDVPPPYDVRGFPTLYWAPKDSKQSPVRYDGGRELEDFIQYIAKQSTEELNGWDRSGKPKKTEL